MFVFCFVLDLRIYRGRISFLPADDMKDYKPKNPHFVVTHNNSSSMKSSASLGISSERKLSDNPTEYSMFNLASAVGTSISSVSAQNIEFKYLPPIDKPVPSDWHIIEDNFVFFLISRRPLISPDFLSAPQAQFSDGHMYLTFIRQGITKLQLLKLFKDMETGDYMESPYVEYVKIKAFRLEPLERRELTSRRARQETTNGAEHPNGAANKGIMMIDGEKVDYGVIQGEIKQELANVLMAR